MSMTSPWRSVESASRTMRCLARRGGRALDSHVDAKIGGNEPELARSTAGPRRHGELVAGDRVCERRTMRSTFAPHAAIWPKTRASERDRTPGEDGDELASPGASGVGRVELGDGDRHVGVAAEKPRSTSSPTDSTGGQTPFDPASSTQAAAGRAPGLLDVGHVRSSGARAANRDSEMPG